MKKDYLKIFYLMLFLAAPIQLYAYHNNDYDGVAFIIGFILLLILIPIGKFIGELLILILTNKKTWYILGTLFVIFLISSIDNKGSRNNRNNDVYPSNAEIYSPKNIYKTDNSNKITNSINGTSNTPTNFNSIVDEHKPVKKTRYQFRKLTCARCHGTGLIICPNCNGRKSAIQRCSTCYGSGSLLQVCSKCGGFHPECPICRGHFESIECPDCNGTGRREELCMKCMIHDGKIECPSCKGSGLVETLCAEDYYE